MRNATAIALLFFLLIGPALADPSRTVQDLSGPAYAQWLQTRQQIWNDELAQLKVFAPERVQAMERTLHQIELNSNRLKATPSPEKSEAIKSETNVMVFNLETELEQVFADLEQVSGPAVVWNY